MYFNNIPRILVHIYIDLKINTYIFEHMTCTYMQLCNPNGIMGSK